MRKLALSDEVLLSVQKPARYLGNEANAVYKDRGKVDIRFAMCFPDVYEVGMSHLGIQILSPRGWTLTKYCGTGRSRFLRWNRRTRSGILTSWELRSSSNSATQMCCRSWTFQESP